MLHTTARIAPSPGRPFRAARGSLRSVLASLACLMLGPLSAQTILYEDLGSFGASTDMLRLVAPGVLPELGHGPNQTWDLSGLTLQAIGTMNFTPAAGTAHAAQFPTANWVWTHTATGVGTAYYYLRATSQGMDLLDRNVGLPDPVIYTDPVQIMKFPFTLGESFTDDYSTGGVINTKHWNFAGYGTLILPSATISGVALVESQEGDVVFWNHNRLCPVMISDEGSTMFYIQNNVGVGEHAAQTAEVWPNPCTHYLNVPQALPGSGWQVLDMQGRILATGKLATGAPQVDVRHLVPGSYVLLLGREAAWQRVRFVKN